ncbi:AraC family transcriptional regulator [Halieaceae bacterium IMCC14734]|uniref:AraC family transcriptional regulator n=1 Tax=Candidatus Litorirhabdus singularis TaxID=2518993 RepID=A0ABT3TEX1_9GAMM|nr:helix-turn-helix domain-containing protein [Candidatus Litorirhabdus singularis]MCX2980862.1 AraC family transcriptional regulator [Candidatus Litorirhabdus singularis]
MATNVPFFITNAFNISVIVVIAEQAVTADSTAIMILHRATVINMQNPQNQCSTSFIAADAPVAKIQSISLTTEDPASFEMALRPWELLCNPSTGGKFKHSLSSVVTPLFSIYQEKISLAAQVRGLSPAGTLVLAIPLGAGRDARYWDEPHSGKTIPATLPGPLDVEIREGHCQLVFMIDLNHCWRRMDQQLADVLMTTVAAHNLPIQHQVLTNLVFWGKRVLDLAHSDLAKIRDAAVLDALTEELVSHLTLIAAQLAPITEKVPNATRENGMRRALEYLRCHRETTHVSVTDLLEIADISERSLQYAFKDAFDMSPLTYMKRRRLHFARQQLLSACSKDTSVSKVATGLGFYELGRFANDYRRVFGQLPSQTLRDY